MFSQRNSRFIKRSKKKSRRNAKRARSKKMAAGFESLEARQLLTVATAPWVANTTFNQFVGEKVELFGNEAPAPTAFGLGIKDFIHVGPAGQPDQTADEPGFIGFEIRPTWNGPCGVDSGTVVCGSQGVSGGRIVTVADDTIFESSWGAEGGLEVDEARIGIEYGFYANAGTASLLQDGDLNYEIESQKNGTWKLSASAAADYGSLRTISPTVSAYADFVVQLDGRIHGELCVAACGGIDEDFEVSEIRVPLASINRQDIEASESQNKLVLDGAIKLFGKESIGDVVADIIVGPNGDREAEADAAINEAQRTIIKNATVEAVNTAQQLLNDASEKKDDAEKAKDAKQKGTPDVIDTSFVDINISPADSGLLGVKGEVSASLPLAETGLSFTTRFATATGTWPEVNLVEINDSSKPIVERDGGNPDYLRASTDDSRFVDQGGNDKRKVLDLNVNAVNLLRMSPLASVLALAGPAAPLVGSGSISAGPLTASLTGIDYDLKTALRVNQQVAANKSDAGTITAYFTDTNGNSVVMESIEGSIPCPSEVEGTPVCFRNGKDITFDPPSNVDDVQVEMGFVRDFEFTNNIGLDFDVQGTLTVLKASLEAFGLKLELGPAFEHTHQLFQSDKLPIFENTFEVTQTAKLDESITIDVRDKSDLSVEIVEAPWFYLADTPGNTFIVHGNVTNHGWGDVENFCLGTDVLKAGLEIVDEGTCVDENENPLGPGIQLGPLAAQESRPLEIEMRVTSAHPSQQVDDVLALRALSADYAEPSFDPDPNNNKATLRIPGVGVQELYVTTSEDTNNPDADCGKDNQACSLREAFLQADIDEGPAVILIEPVDALGQRVNPVLNDQIDVVGDFALIGQGSSETMITGDSTNGFLSFIVDKSTITGITFKGGTIVDPTGIGGGAITAFVRDSFDLDDVRFLDNLTDGDGGGALFVGVQDSAFEPNITIRNSRFEGNSSQRGSGGAIQANGLGALTIENSTFKRNTADFSGGAIQLSPSETTVSISNSTFSHNQALVGAAIGVFESLFSPPGSASVNIADSYFFSNDHSEDLADNFATSNSAFTGQSGNLYDDYSLGFGPGIPRWQTSAASFGAGFLDTSVFEPITTRIGDYNTATGGGISYEFIYNVPRITGSSSAFMGSRGFAGEGGNAAIKFDQNPNTGKYGSTEFGVADYESNTGHKLGVDTHVVFVADGTDMDIYVNGEFAETMPGASVTISGLTSIGEVLDEPGGSFDQLGGALLGVAVYDVALDADAIRANFNELAAVADDRSNTNLFDISGAGRPIIGVDIQRELDGAVVGGIIWNGFEDLVDVQVKSPDHERFEIVARVLKLKEGEALPPREQGVSAADDPPFEITLEFTDSTGRTFEDTLKLKPGSLPDAITNFQISNNLLGLVQNEQGKFVFAQPSAQLTWTRQGLTSYDLQVIDDGATPNDPTDDQNLATINEGACSDVVGSSCTVTVDGLPYFTDLTYTLIPRNKFGAGEKAVGFDGEIPTVRTRIEPSGIPQDLQVTAISPTEFELTWSQDVAADRVRGYDVELYDEQGTNIQSIRLDDSDATPSDGTYFDNYNADACVDASSNENVQGCEFAWVEGQPKLTLRDLEPITTATFVLSSFNSSGGSKGASATGSFTPVVTQFSSALQVEALSPSSVSLNWSDVDHELNYQVVFGVSGDTETPRARRFFTADSSTATINNLSPGSTYEFYVVAANGNEANRDEPSRTERVIVTMPDGPAETVVEDVTSPLDSAFRVDGSNDTVVVDVASVEASSFWGDRVAAHLIDGSGLDATGDSHDTEPSNMWLTAANDENPTVTFQLGEEAELTKMRVWNYTEDVPGRLDLVGRAVQEASISILTNGTFRLLKNVTFSPFDPASGMPHRSEVIDLRDDAGQPISAEAVRIEVISNHNGKIYGDPTSDDGFDNFTGLAEVQFFNEDTYSAPPEQEDIDKVFDNTTNKYLNFLDLNSGVNVTPVNGASVVTGVRVYTANDAEASDPASYKLEGLNANGDYETISAGPLALPSARNAGGQEITASNSLNQYTVPFENTKVYSTYQLTFPTLKDAVAANSMQVAEIELLGTIGEPDTACAPPTLNSISDCAENLEQRDQLLSQLDLLLADLDGDGTVGFSDFLQLSANFGEDDKRYTDGDIDLNGSVEFADFLVLSQQFGKSR